MINYSIETWLFPVIFIVYYFFFRIFATNFVKMSYYIINS